MGRPFIVCLSKHYRAMTTLLHTGSPSVSKAVTIVLLCLGMVAGGAGRAEEKGEALVAVQKAFTQDVGPHLNAYILLNQGYRRALERLLEEQTQGAKLEMAVLVRKEIEAFAEGQDFTETGFRKRLVENFPALRSLQNTYLVSHAKITTDTRGALLAALAGYEQRLAQLQDELTRTGKLDEAQAVSATREEVKVSPATAIHAALAATEDGTVYKGLFVLSAPSAAVGEVNGNLLLVAKGTVELFHNGRKVVVRNQANHDAHFMCKVPERTCKVGDTVVLRVRSPVVYRAIAAAINRAGKGGQISVKNTHWRFLGEEKDASKITAEDITASNTMLPPATPDGEGVKDREGLGILPASQGGSDWVKSANQLNGWYCVGFVVTAEMITAP